MRIMTLFRTGTCLLLFAPWVAGADPVDVAKPSQTLGRPLAVLKELPLDAAQYQPRAAELVTSGVPARFGAEEWAAVVLTHEFHQHVGIYTIIGAKMGVRARERLDAPMRAVRVRCESGVKPPFACMNDGIQVALSSTFAQGLIESPPAEEPRVAARFEYEKRTVRLRLKPEFEQRLARMIAESIEKHGNLTPAYFSEIETLSYRVWAEWDRREIFDERDETISAPSPTP